jgi:two-component system phosphate regulon response regulator PhoB
VTSWGGIDIDTDRRHAYIGGRRFHLPIKEFNVLAVLVQFAGTIVPHEILIQRVWPDGVKPKSRTIHVHVSKLRRRLRENGGPDIKVAMTYGYFLVARS